MSRMVIWSPKSRENFLDILGYLQDEWGRGKAMDFMEKTDVVLEKITVYPLMYPKTGKRDNLRRAVITKQTSLTYEVMEESIELVAFYDNRRGKR